MGRGHKRRNWKAIVISVLVFMLAISICIVVQGYQWLQQSNMALENVNQQLMSYRKVLYVAAAELPVGTVLSEENVRQEVRYTDQCQEDFISEEEFGLELKEQVAEGASLMKRMLKQTADNVREVYITDIELPKHLESGNCADVRIRYSNAEDYTVLANKVLQLSEDRSGVVLKLTEEELLLLSAAVADCYTYERTSLYAVKYPEYYYTTSGTVNYIATHEVLRMLGETVEKERERGALEQRLERGKYD